MADPDYVTPSSAKKGAEAARKATGIGPAPQPSRARALLEWLTGYPADPTREMNPLEVLAAVPAIGAAPKFLKGATKLDEAADIAQKGIRAYHGSPHDFDRFDLSKIGTGEGAQAYGHGLYFAEKEGTAKNYRDALTQFGHASEMPEHMKTSILLDDKVVSGKRPSNQLSAIERAALTRHYAGGNQAQAIRDVEEALRYLPKGSPVARMEQETLDALRSQDFTGRIKPFEGRMYEVNIAADPATLLDWDAPLTSQSPQVQEALKDLGFEDWGNLPIRQTRQNWNAGAMKGDSMYRAIAEDAPVADTGLAQSAASAALRERGVPGIRYWDQGSRTAGQGTSNYSIFDDRLISILRKYGLLGAAGAGAATQRDALLQQLQGDGAQ